MHTEVPELVPARMLNEYAYDMPDHRHRGGRCGHLPGCRQGGRRYLQLAW